jgi:small subunit ribosomal protein S10
MKSEKNRYELCISLKSFDFYYIENTLKKIYEILFCLKVYTHKLIVLPKSRKLYTVLRSPHIDKKSREQFEFTRCKTHLILASKNFSKIAFIIFMIKQSDFPGVEIELCINYSTFYI